MTLKFTYNKRYMTQGELCIVHGISKRTLDRWIANAKQLGQTIPGRIKFRAHQSYVWDPVIFHQWLQEVMLVPESETKIIFKPTMQRSNYEQ